MNKKNRAYLGVECILLCYVDNIDSDFRAFDLIAHFEVKPNVMTHSIAVGSQK